MSLSTFTLAEVISLSFTIADSRNTKPSSSILEHEEGTELSLACTSLSVCPKPALSELVFSTLEYLALCWSWEEEKVFLVMFGQEGGLGRVKFCLEELEMLYPTIGWVEGWEESLCDPWEEEISPNRFWLKEKLILIILL